MAFVLPGKPSLIGRHKVFIIGGILFLGGIILVVMGIGRMKVKANDMEVLARVRQITDSLALYYFLRNDYPPADQSHTERVITLGGGEAQCLDRSDAGLRSVCSGSTLLWRFPSGRFQYKKSGRGDFALGFHLGGSLDGLGDTNRDGIIECSATPQGVRCE